MTEPVQYRKKPVVIEAIRYTVESCSAVHDFLGIENHNPDAGGCDQGIYIKTLEGYMRADVGDWIIRGVQGEFYPCKPDIFDATYEAVE